MLSFGVGFGCLIAAWSWLTAVAAGLSRERTAVAEPAIPVPGTR